MLRGAMRLLDERTPDGSRHFARLPKIAPWEVVRDHVLLLRGAKIINDINRGAAATWLDFAYREHRFVIHCHESELRLYVHDPQCSDVVLFQVGSHLERLAEKSRQS